MTDHERVADLFYSRDFPVLVAIAQWEIEGRPDRALEPREIVERMGTSIGLQRVLESIRRLAENDYIEAKDNSTHDELDFMVTAMTERGLRECGAWPEAKDLAAAFKASLEAQATELENSDPERGKKVRTILAAMGDLGTDFAAKFSAEFAKAYFHL